MRTPSRTSLFVAAVLALGLAVAPRAAHAEPDDPAMSTASKTRFNEGMRLFGKRRYDEARVAFLQANALKKRPSVTLMLARCALETGRALEALEHVDAYLAAVPEPTPKVRALLDAVKRDATAKLGHLRIVVPDGAVVMIDGAVRTEATTGAVIDVMPGRHDVLVTAGDESKALVLDVAAGATALVSPPFKPRALRPATVARIEKPKPSVLPVSADSAPGSESPGVLTPPSTTWPIYGAGAIGLGGLTAAVILGGLTSNADHAVTVAEGALARNNATRARCSQPTVNTPFDSACSEIRRNESASNKLGGATTVALGVGLTGVALAVGWYLFAPKSASSHLGASNGGATFEGTF